jgi:hypothetical protein
MTTVLTYPQTSRAVSRRAADVDATLRADGPALAALATAQAIAAAAPLQREGRFRRPPSPRVETAVADRGPAAIRVTWDHDPPDAWPPRAGFATRPTSSWWRTGEEETGWPVADLDLVVEPSSSGARVTAVSSRPPGVDLSTNRVDRHLRDRLARAAIDRFLDALVLLLEEGGAAPARDV